MIARVQSDSADALAWQARAIGLDEPEREFRFHPTRRWRFDLAWPDRMVAVEVDGAVYAGGRHTRGNGFEADNIKFAEAALMGWTVLRFSTDQVADGVAIGYVERLLTTVLVPGLPEPEPDPPSAWSEVMT